MSRLRAIFRAGFTRRWHTNPDLAHIEDRTDGHSARVARIIFALHPGPSVDLIRAALTHDDGESVVGDVKAPLKDARPDIAEALAEVEADAVQSLWGRCASDDLAEIEAIWLKFADRLDAFMWTAHHAPHVLTGDGWPEARTWLLAQADALGCGGSVLSLMEEIQ